MSLEIIEDNFREIPIGDDLTGPRLSFYCCRDKRKANKEEKIKVQSNAINFFLNFSTQRRFKNKNETLATISKRARKANLR